MSFLFLKANIRSPSNFSALTIQTFIYFKHWEVKSHVTFALLWCCCITVVPGRGESRPRPQTWVERSIAKDMLYLQVFHGRPWVKIMSAFPVFADSGSASNAPHTTTFHLARKVLLSWKPSGEWQFWRFDWCLLTEVHEWNQCFNCNLYLITDISVLEWHLCVQRAWTVCYCYCIHVSSLCPLAKLFRVQRNRCSAGGRKPLPWSQTILV